MESRPTALVVDDDPVIRRLVVHGLGALDFERVLEADDGQPAKQLLLDHDIDIAVTDLDMRDVDGIDLIRWAQQYAPNTTWIILSGVESFDIAVEAIQLGAFDFLSKPPDVRKLEVAVRNALSHRELIAEKERLLEELQASSLELLDKVKELARKSEVIRQDLERAEEIQRALLPSEPPEVDGLCIASLSRPGDSIGGDLYDVVTTDDGKLVCYVADATGHGVSAAMLAVMFKRHLSMRGPDGATADPSAVLELLNRRLTASLRTKGLFLTAAYCVVDLGSSELRVASAGHPPLMLLRKGGEVIDIERTGAALGLAADSVFRQHRLQLEPGDRLLLHTDGLLDGPSASGSDDAREFLIGGLGAEVASGQARLQAMFDQSVQRFRGGLPNAERDDITMVLIELARGASSFDNGDREEVAEPETVQSAPVPVVWVAEAPGVAWFCLRGRGTWTHAEEFFRRTCQAIDGGRRVALDLSRCDYLDSTFLGTIHELVCRGDGNVAVVEPTVGVRGLFAEMSMEKVLSCVRADVQMPSTEPVPVVAEGGHVRESQLRLLRAHETLAAMGERNRAKFQQIVDALRSELGLSGPPESG